MPRPIDPDTLRVPAFMLKRSLRRRAAKPLLLTALDRKQAGVKPQRLAKKAVRQKWTRTPKYARPIPEQGTFFTQPTDHAQSRPRMKPKVTKKIRTSTVKLREAKTKLASPIFASPVFEAPIIGSEPTPKSRTKSRAKVKAPKSKKVGVVSHYYGKIQVAVFTLSATLSVKSSRSRISSFK